MSVVILGPHSLPKEVLTDDQEQTTTTQWGQPGRIKSSPGSGFRFIPNNGPDTLFSPLCDIEKTAGIVPFNQIGLHLADGCMAVAITEVQASRAGQNRNSR